MSNNSYLLFVNDKRDEREMEKSSSMIFITKTNSSSIFNFKIDLLPTEEATLKRLLTHPTVEGIILANEEGQLQFSSLDNNVTFFITSKLLSFADMARSIIRDMDPTDNLLTFRLRTQQKEMMVVAPQDAMQIIAIQKINSPLTIIQQTADEYNDNL